MQSNNCDSLIEERKINFPATSITVFHNNENQTQRNNQWKYWLGFNLFTENVQNLWLFFAQPKSKILAFDRTIHFNFSLWHCYAYLWNDTDSFSRMFLAFCSFQFSRVDDVLTARRMSRISHLLIYVFRANRMCQALVELENFIAAGWCGEGRGWWWLNTENIVVGMSVLFSFLASNSERNVRSTICNSFLSNGLSLG